MKRFTLSLLALVLSTAVFTPVAKADSYRNTLTPRVDTTTNDSSTRSAFEVVTLAYQGRLANQGIPSYDALAAGVNTGQFTGEAVVNAAIAAGQLTQDSADQRFISTINRYLDHLSSQS